MKIVPRKPVLADNRESESTVVYRSNNHMQVDWRSTASLSRSETDPRRYNRKDVGRAEQIIRRFGVRLPLIIAPDGTVLVGGIVLAAAQGMKLDELPVLAAGDMSFAEQKALSVAMNRLYEMGDFDRQLLGGLLTELQIEIPDIQFEDMGLEIAEADLAILAFEDDGTEAEDEENVPGGPAVSRFGDRWLLGGHVIACGDAGDGESYDLLLQGAIPKLVLGDPPYGIRVEDISSQNHREFVQGSQGAGETEMLPLFGKWCEQICRSAGPGSLVYLFIDWRSLRLLLDAAIPIFGELLNLIVWNKNRAGMGSLYRSQHELICLFRVPGGKNRNNIELGKHGRNRSNVWNYPSALSFGRSSVEGDLLKDHPTPKPKEMLAEAILDSTARGDIVLDPFLGSGSTLIAAETVGRHCYGMDLDPLYVDLAVRRLQAWTGKQAVHASSGRLFDDIAADQPVSPYGEAE